MWWPDTYGLNATHLTLQFRAVNAARSSQHLPRFTSEIVGTRSTATPFVTWHDVEAKLVNIPVNRSNSDHALTPDETTTTQLRVPGSITGILIPNTSQVSMRVIAPIMDGGRELPLDNTFVQWTTVSVKSYASSHQKSNSSICPNSDSQLRGQLHSLDDIEPHSR